jgi:cell division protein FtsQ
MSKRGMLLIVIFFILSLLGVSIFFMNTTQIAPIRVEGNEHMSREEIIELVGFNDQSTVLEVLMNRVTTIKNKSYVSKMEISYNSLRDIHIQVYEKDIIGYILYMGKYICIDANGYIVDYTDKPDNKRPKIIGLDLTTFSIDKPIDVSEKTVRMIDLIYRNSLSFEVPIEWIDFQFSNGNQIILKKGGVDIRIGDGANLEEKFNALKEVFKALPVDKKGVLYAEDVTGNIVFKSYD